MVKVGIKYWKVCCCVAGFETETFFQKSFHHTGFHTNFSFHKLSTNSWRAEKDFFDILEM